MAERYWHPGDRRAAATAVVALVSARLALAILPFSTVRDGLFRVSRFLNRHAPETHASDVEASRAVIRSVLRATRLMPGARCLPRAMAGLVVASSIGLPATLWIGVAGGADGPFGAHAWLSVDGRPIIGAEEAEGHVPILSISARGIEGSSRGAARA